MAQTVTKAVNKCKPGKTSGLRVLRAALLAIVILLTTGIAALPAELPDQAPHFIYTFVNRSLLETDDFLIYALYDIPYATLPLSAVCNTYIIEMIDTDGVTVLASTEDTGKPYPYHDLGYNLGVVSFYFVAADNPGWGELYTLRIKGDPAEFLNPPVYNYTLAASAYSDLDSTDSAGNQLEVANNVKSIAGPLSIEFGVDLFSYQDQESVLTSDGETYFLNTIPELRNIAPSLFYFQIISPDAGTRAWGTSLGDTYKARLAGVDGIVGTGDDNWIMGSISGLADWINVPIILIGGIVVVIVCVLLIRTSMQRFGTPVAGYVASLLVVSCAGMLMLGLTLVAIIAFALALFGGWFAFFRHT